MPAHRDAFWRFEKSGWERVAERYETSWHDLTCRFVEPLLAAAGIGPGARLLDVACGLGDLCAEAARRGALPLGVDFSGAMTRLARRRHPHLRFRQGDAAQLPLADAAFDAVTMGFGVPHLAAPEAAFAEARRVLRPGGRFAFSVWAKPEDNPGIRIIAGAVEAHADLAVDLPEGPSFVRFADAAECRRCLAAAGFAPASIAFTTHQVLWRVPTAGFLFETERDAGVRTAALLAKQTPERLAAIRAAVEAGVRRYADGDAFALPMVAHVVAAAVPAG